MRETAKGAKEAQRTLRILAALEDCNFHAKALRVLATLEVKAQMTKEGAKRTGTRCARAFRKIFTQRRRGAKVLVALTVKAQKILAALEVKLAKV